MRRLLASYLRPIALRGHSTSSTTGSSSSSSTSSTSDSSSNSCVLCPTCGHSHTPKAAHHPPTHVSSLGGTVEEANDRLRREFFLHPRPQRGRGVEDLLQFNKEWSTEVRRLYPDFFSNLSQQQTPQYLWIGCSDSRVPANQLIGLAPGEVFVHRNVANVVAHSDLNCLSVLQFAVECLKVEHVIVCGHYGCGGVNAALNDLRVGLADNWIMHVADVKKQHVERLQTIQNDKLRLNLLCELNSITQLSHVADSHVIQDWWASRSAHRVELHGWVYGLNDGLVHELLHVTPESDKRAVIQGAVEASFRKFEKLDRELLQQQA